MGCDTETIVDMNIFLSEPKSSPIILGAMTHATSMLSVDEHSSALSPRSGAGQDPHILGSKFPASILKVRDTLKKSLYIAANKYATVEQMNAMISTLRQVMQENESLKIELETVKHSYVRMEQVSFAIAHNGASERHEAMQKLVESNPTLLGYYNGFVNTFQKYITGFMARNSGAVAASPEFFIPGLDFVPLPPIADQVVHAAVTVIDTIVTIREDNAISRALKSLPDLAGFLTHTIPKLACELSTNTAYSSKIIHLKPTEHFGIFKVVEYYERLKYRFFENDTPTPQMELGAADALKIIAALKQGHISSELISNDDYIIRTMLGIVQEGMRQESIVDNRSLEPIREEGLEGETETYDSRIHSNAPSSAHATLISLALPPPKEPAVQVQRHWYDCLVKTFCCYTSGHREPPAPNVSDFPQSAIINSDTTFVLGADAQSSEA